MSILRALGWGLYQLLLALALPLAAPLLARRRGLRHYLATLRGRLALGLGRPSPESSPARLWIHAVSVGEVAVAAALVRALDDDLPLVVTTVTPTGQEQARRRFAEPGRAEVAYLPFDLAWPVGRFLRRFRPAALVLVEGDYWPLALSTAHRRGLPVAVVNGRSSDRAFARQRLLGPVNRLFYGPVERFGVQTEEDRRRLRELGVPSAKVRVTGNLKFDSPEPEPRPGLEALFADLAGQRPMVVAGSTMEGEEGQVLDAFDAAGGGRRALLVLAPRHPERFDAVAALLAARGTRWLRRSGLDVAGAASGEHRGDVDVVLLDSLGELAALYRSASAAFVGGTLVATGGHNPIEPARFGVPTVVGPSMFNFRDVAARFTAAGAWRQVGDAHELGDVLAAWLDEPAAARQVGARGAELVASQRGAVERSVEVLAPLLDACRRTRR